MPRSLTQTLIAFGNLYRRLLSVVFALIGPTPAYAVMQFLARRLYRLATPLRDFSETQCRAALAGRFTDPQIARIAERAFVHRAWNLVDLMLAERRLYRGAFRRYGGIFPEPYLGLLQDAAQKRRPVLLLTCYYGPYDLLPMFLGFNGFNAGAVYRPHLNPRYDAFRNAVRSRGGCEMIPDSHAVARLPQILESGGMVALLSDHHEIRRGTPVKFLGLQTVASRAVGILAVRHDAVVVVAGIRRQHRPFNFEIVVSDYFDAEAWRALEDPVLYVTERYVAGMEKLVLEEPEQYLWAHPRWGPSLARPTEGEAQSAD